MPSKSWLAPLTCSPGAHSSRAVTPESLAGTTAPGELGCGATTQRGQNGGEGEKLLSLFFDVGREAENNALTQHGYSSCSDKPQRTEGAHRGLLVHPKASSL